MPTSLRVKYNSPAYTHIRFSRIVLYNEFLAFSPCAHNVKPNKHKIGVYYQRLPWYSPRPSTRRHESVVRRRRNILLPGRIFSACVVKSYKKNTAFIVLKKTPRPLFAYMYIILFFTLSLDIEWQWQTQVTCAHISFYFQICSGIPFSTLVWGFIKGKGTPVINRYTEGMPFVDSKNSRSMNPLCDLDRLVAACLGPFFVCSDFWFVSSS